MKAAMVALARALGVETGSEDRESEERLSQRWALGATQGQGYYFARPMPAHLAAAQRLARSKR